MIFLSADGCTKYQSPFGGLCMDATVAKKARQDTGRSAPAGTPGQPRGAERRKDDWNNHPL